MQLNKLAKIIGNIYFPPFVYYLLFYFHVLGIKPRDFSPIVTPHVNGEGWRVRAEWLHKWGNCKHETIEATDL